MKGRAVTRAVVHKNAVAAPSLSHTLGLPLKQRKTMAQFEWVYTNTPTPNTTPPNPTPPPMHKLMRVITPLVEPKRLWGILLCAIRHTANHYVPLKELADAYANARSLRVRDNTSLNKK